MVTMEELIAHKAVLCEQLKEMKREHAQRQLEQNRLLDRMGQLSLEYQRHILDIENEIKNIQLGLDNMAMHIQNQERILQVIDGRLDLVCDETFEEDEYLNPPSPSTGIVTGTTQPSTDSTRDRPLIRVNIDARSISDTTGTGTDVSSDPGGPYVIKVPCVHCGHSNTVFATDRP